MSAARPDARAERWVPVIGLECHVQLDTRTKLFCGCAYRFGAAPNSLTCPVCTAQPGALPVMNREALRLAVRAGLAVGARIAPASRFERKNYFYCDLPKGYQISQYREPLCAGGAIVLASGKRVRLNRIHLEEDAGKAIHDRGDMTLVDLNRAGVPLIECVSEADLGSSTEAHEYLTALKETLQYAGVSGCDMEKGELRCDVNVSVHRPGAPWGTKVEIKNLNSFRFAAAAIEHEIVRQVALLEAGGAIVQETRLYDNAAGVTRAMRGKESAHDYRYFAEPDLPPLVVHSDLLERERGTIPELPAARRARYVAELGLPEADAAVLTSERVVADFFEAAARLSQRPRECANWIQNELLRWVGGGSAPYPSFGEIPLKPFDLASVVAFVGEGRLSGQSAKKLLAEIARTGKSAKSLVQELGLEQVGDAAQIEAWCRAALAGQERIVADVRAGKAQALNALLGPVMRASGGKADAALVRATLLRLIGVAGS
jgi:aspartyl-tRNA(Asn)/glutamyl-tRNA(Gln) amidotransferase subunit B